MFCLQTSLRGCPNASTMVVAISFPVKMGSVGTADTKLRASYTTWKRDLVYCRIYSRFPLFILITVQMYHIKRVKPLTAM
jgi:hypothetical protein